MIFRKEYKQLGTVNVGTVQDPSYKPVMWVYLELDSTADLADLNPSSQNYPFSDYALVTGSEAHIIDGNTMYMMKSDNTWVIQDEASRMNVYTKDETDQLLTDMADSQANVDLAQDEKINNNEDRIIELINSGHKNLCRFMQGTDTQFGTTFTPDSTNGTLTTSGTATRYYGYRILGSQADTTYNNDVPIPKGTYVLTGLPEGASSTTHRFILGIWQDSAGTRTSTSIYDDVYEFEITGYQARIDLTAYVATGNASGAHTTWTPMIVPKEIYDITPDFVPYCPTLQELYQMVRSYHP